MFRTSTNLSHFSSLALSLVFLSVSYAGPLSADKPSPAPSMGANKAQAPVATQRLSEDVNAQLKKAVVESETQLGALDPAKQKMFDEEIVPQYALFIKDYHQQGALVQSQVDIDSIKNYLSFSATKDLTMGSTQLLLLLNVDGRCSKCVLAAPTVRKMMIDRAQSHGFQPVWITPDELLDAKPSELAQKRNTAGAMEASLIPAPMDDVDSAHADEKQYIAKLSFDIRAIAHYEDQSELFETDSFEQVSGKMLTQAYVELGAKALLSGAGAMKQEMQITVTGFTDFQQYSQLKSSLQAKLKDVASVEERKMSRGKAVFAIKTNRTLDEVKKMVQSLGHMEVEMR
jgi:hypothetical protein